MDPLVEADLLAVGRPNFVRDAATPKTLEQAQVLGYEITQQKTWAKFSSPFQVIAVGSTNLAFIPNNFQYPDSEHFIITAIRIYQGASATLNATAWTPGIAAGDVQNGQFSVGNAGTLALKDFPFTMFSQGTNNADGGYVFLSKPIVWLGQTNLTFNASFPVALSTTNLNLRIELIGLKLI